LNGHDLPVHGSDLAHTSRSQRRKRPAPRD
jgi:hypothetical protein